MLLLVMVKRILADADSMPQNIRAIILRRAEKEGIPAVFVADRRLSDVDEAIKEHTIKLRQPLRGLVNKEDLRKIKSPIRQETVQSGANSADDYIVSLCEEGDLVISHDIPLLERAIEKGAFAIDDRGNVFTSENIRKRMSEREVNSIFREMGVFAEQTKRQSAKALEEFANAFDRVLAQK